MIEFQLNGEQRAVQAGGTTPLLAVLRDSLGDLTPKPGCWEGRCGACTVLLDGDPIPSCLTPVGRVAGRAITTLEGLGGPDGQLNAVQRSFEDLGAVQCGICTSGMILSVQALLDEGRPLDRAQIQRALVNNLCRCTGYTKILDAVEELLTEQGGPDG